MDHEVQALIPFYINGTLAPEEKVRVEEALLENRECREDFYRWLRVHHVLVTQSWQKEFKPSSQEKLFHRLPKRKTLYIPIRKAKARYFKIPSWIWQPLALAIVVLQFIAIGLFIAGIHVEKQSTYYALASEEMDITRGGTVFNIIFQPTITEKEMREFLLHYDAKIIRGPNKVGLYQIAIPLIKKNTLMNLKRDYRIKFMEKKL